jgi:hypothetical protein
MKPIGSPPPRSKDTDRIKAQIYREACDQRNKKPVPTSAILDQFGCMPETEPDSPLDCCQCSERFEFGKGFIFDGKTGECWCPDCFREHAEKLLKSS